MKKRTIIEITAAVICILLLLGLGVFLFIDYQNELSPPKEGSGEKETSFFGLDEGAADTEAAVSAADEQTAAALAAASASSVLPEHQIIFVGDSRTVGMASAEKDTEDTCIYIGESGEGYQWFIDSGLSLMEDAMRSSPEAPIVISLGVNDPSEIEKYLALYQGFSDEYPEHTFYFMSVNPVTEKATHITNAEIGEFNARLRAAFPDQYLDCYTYMMIREFESVDGVHYSEDTYRMIHDFTVKQLNSLFGK